VDTVIYLEGERYQQHRVLRAVKNRFGSTADIGILEMTPSGLVGVENPSLLLTSSGMNMGTGETKEGCAVGIVMEGSRPLITEIQALVSGISYGSAGQPTPVRRVAIGLDSQRMSVILAILQRRASVKFSRTDCWVSVMGGLKLSDTPACDLAIAVALASSRTGKLVPADTCFAAEIGLGGELRPLPQMERRLQEAAQFGFSKCVCAPERTRTRDRKEGGKRSAKNKTIGKMKVLECESLSDALKWALVSASKQNFTGKIEGDALDESLQSSYDDDDL